MVKHTNKANSYKRLLSYWGSERGKINFLTIVLVAIVMTVVYLAIMLGPSYIEHTKLKAKISAVANMAHREKDVNVLQKHVLKETEILDMDLPVDAVEIEMDTDGKWVRFYVEYERIVEMTPFGAEMTLHFDFDHTEEL